MPENGVSQSIFSEFKGLKIFRSGDFEDMVSSFEELIEINFSDKDKKDNVSVLRSSYLRESQVSKIIDNFKNLS